jgi:hypothetical protein
MPKRKFQQIAGGAGGDGPSLTEKLAKAFGTSDALHVVIDCPLRKPRLLSITFLGFPLVVKGVEGITPQELVPGPVPPTATPHWQAGEEGCYPGVYKAGDAVRKARITVDPGDFDLEEYELIGVSRKAGVIFDESTCEGNTFTCTVQTAVKWAMYGAWTIEWAVRQKDTLTHYLLGTTEINLFFLWDAPCGPWLGGAVWYEALLFALGRLAARGQKTRELCLGAMVDGLLRSEALSYDTLTGAAGCGWSPLAEDPGTFNFAKFMGVEFGLFNKGGYYEIAPGIKGMRQPVKVCCYDTTAALCVTGCAVGLLVEPYVMGHLDSRIKENAMMVKKNVRIIGFLQSKVPVGGFATHVFAMHDGKVYEGLLATANEEGPSPFFALSIQDYLTATVEEKDHESLAESISPLKLRFTP